MEDLTADMRPNKPISKKMRDKLERERIEARERIIERGIVHFRADQEFMKTLLDAADRSKVPPGTLCRRIVWEHLTATSKPPRKTNETGAAANQKILEKLDEIQLMLSQSVRSKSATKESKRRRA